MATHDYVIANASGAAVRADLNNALAAIVSNNSNATSPASTYSYQFWADTTANQLKIRNAANDAWITLMELDGTMLMENGTAAAPGLAFSDDVDTGLFRPAANQLGIATSGVERVEFGTTEVVFNDSGADVDFRIEGDAQANLLKVDAGNDRIGIGQASPNALLEVNSDTDGQEVLRLEGDYTGSGDVTLANFRRDGGAVAAAVQYHDSLTAMSIGSTTNHSFTFRTNDTERMRIDFGGTLLVGKTAANATGSGAEIRTAGSGQMILGKTYSGTVNGIYFNHNSSYVGGLNYTNTGTSLQTSSDYRLKENIVAVSNGVTRVKQLNPVRFNFIAEPGETVEGFIAHELGQVVPEACCGEKDAVNEDGSVKPQTIAQEKIIPLLTAALQEAIAKIETLETKVAALEAA